jgi:maleylacetate reductase
MDAAKAVACWLAFGGLTPHSEGAPAPRVIVIPTTSAAASVTGAIALYEGDELVRVSDSSLAPGVVILDPEVAVTAPAALAVASGFVALAHAIETTYSLARDPYSTSLALEGLRLIGVCLPKLTSDPTSLVIRSQLQIGAIGASLAVRSARGSLQHAAAHALFIRCHVPHATAHAIMLPHTVRVQPDVIAAALDASAKALGAPEGVDRWCTAVLASAALPARLRDVGVRDSDVSGLIAAIAGDRGRLDLDPRQLDTSAIERMLRAAL